MFEVTIELEGDVDEAWLKPRLFVLGELIISEIRNKIEDFDLLKTSSYWREWFVHVEGTRLFIDNANKYAEYLEYGTYEYGAQYGEDSYPQKPLKKKDLPKEIARLLPKGVAPFAVVRRTLYDDAFMKAAAETAFSAE